jgi:putative transposase
MLGTTGAERSTNQTTCHATCGDLFPNPEGLLRLAGAVLAETHDEWQISDRRYLSEGSMALLTTPTREVPLAQLMPA